MRGMQKRRKRQVFNNNSVKPTTLFDIAKKFYHLQLQLPCSFSSSIMFETAHILSSVYCSWSLYVASTHAPTLHAHKTDLLVTIFTRTK